MKLLLVTLEYRCGTFSGNGVYSQSIVRSLINLGHSVFVVSASPPNTWGAEPPTRGQLQGEAALVEVSVPVWGRLDASCGWEPFAEGLQDPTLLQRIVSFRPEWALIVDWSALPAFRQVAACDMWAAAGVPVPPLAFLNFRVYTLSEYSGPEKDKEVEFYRKMETEAVGCASLVAGLSARDALFLVDPDGLGSLKREGVQGRALLPPLREDIRQLALSRQNEGVEREEVGRSSWPVGRRHLSCCVRLSPEKNALLFAAMVEHLAPFLREEGILPLLCLGAGSGSSAYAAQVASRVRTAVPASVVVEGFMGPHQMAEVYSQTLLNIHPCLYDAYGMTIVESAAFAAPSMVHLGPGGAVGALDLLTPGSGVVLTVDMSADIDQVCEEVKRVLRDRNMLAGVGLEAAQRSLAWSEDANARQLTNMLVGSAAVAWRPVSLSKLKPNYDNDA